MKSRLSKSPYPRPKGKLKKEEQERQTFPEIVQQVLREADIILEILDARFIEETINPDLQKLAEETGKRLIYVLNKSDLTDYQKTRDKVNSLNLHPYVLVSSTKRRGIRDLRTRIKIEAQKVETQNLRVQVVVIGYPNTGKSSLINVLTGRGAAPTSLEPGFTKGIKKIKLSTGIVLLDTPGVIPKEESKIVNAESMVKHAMIGIKNYDRVRDPEFVVHSLIMRNPGVFEKTYGIETEDSDLFLEKLGRKKHFLKKGNEIDTNRTARLILKDWQTGRIRV